MVEGANLESGYTLTRIEGLKKMSGTFFHVSPAGVNRKEAMNKKLSGTNFTIHILVNSPAGCMKKFSRNFFDAEGARRVKCRTHFIHPSLTIAQQAFHLINKKRYNPQPTR